jgi:hypothetical protein
MKNAIKNQTTCAMSLLLMAAAFAGAATPAHAQDTTTGGTATMAPDTTEAPMDAGPLAGPWQFGVTVPAWIAGIDGNVTVLGHQQDVNVDFNTLREHLDQSLSLGLNVRKGRLGIYGDVGYMKFSGGFNGPFGGNTSANLKFLVSDGGLSYVLFKAGDERPFVLSANAGVRYWYTDTSLTFHGPLGNVVLSGGKTRDIVDPVLGLSASQFLTRKLHLDFSVDGGGFDINNDTDWTWSATGVVTYDIWRWLSVSAGYKALALDEASGSGGNKNGVNLIFNGVLIAAQIKF